MLLLITLNKYLKTKYGLGLRNILTTTYHVTKIIDFFELPVFKASTDTCITVIKNCKQKAETRYFPIKTLDNLDLSKHTKGNYQKVIKDENEWKFIDTISEEILRKLYEDTTSLKDFVKGKIFSGIKTAFNPAFILDGEILKTLLKSESKKIIKKYAKSTDIQKYFIKNDNKYFLATGYDLDIKTNYPTAYKYLKQYEKELKNRQDKGKYWWNLRACAYYSDIELPKIIYIHTAINHQFYFDIEGRYINNSCYMIISDNKYLFAFLNSKLFKWFKKIKFVAYGDAAESGRVKLDNNKMVTVPIKNITSEQQRQFEASVDKILSCKRKDQNIDVKDIENNIDNLLYKLYGLSQKEIDTVESN